VLICGLGFHKKKAAWNKSSRRLLCYRLSW
jgi:hypothetical protein